MSRLVAQFREVFAVLWHLLRDRGGDVVRFGIRKAAIIERYELELQAMGADIATYRLLIEEGIDPAEAYEQAVIDQTYIWERSRG